MLDRKHGGIVLMSSLSAFQGSAYIATYSATKAFNIVLAEGLWEEWREQGVDVLVCVSGAVKTPNYVASEPTSTGGLGDMTMDAPQVVREALDALGKRPYVIPGRVNRLASFVMRHLLSRRAAIQFMGRILRRKYVDQ
jgi:short-subunit dehydrogenase